MSRNKRRSYHVIVKPGHWWFPSLKRWVKDEDFNTLNGCFSSHRQLHTIKRLESAIVGTEPPFYAGAHYYKNNKHGKGWQERWVYDERSEE